MVEKVIANITINGEIDPADIDKVIEAIGGHVTNLAVEVTTKEIEVLYASFTEDDLRKLINLPSNTPAVVWKQLKTRINDSPEDFPLQLNGDETVMSGDLLATIEALEGNDSLQASRRVLNRLVDTLRRIGK